MIEFTREEREQAVQDLRDEGVHAAPSSWAATLRCENTRQSGELLRLREMLREAQHIIVLERSQFFKKTANRRAANMDLWLKKAQEAL